jgi:hypothetical protein
VDCLADPLDRIGRARFQDSHGARGQITGFAVENLQFQLDADGRFR